ncbi:MAG: UDP-N-acetylmuramate:L-alanyl-gamma-D-glutamyl-meso-diaminopimelate ligase [Deltaproteobacteria bacterium]|nr:UDP-N-acetylmuramate:L-alanyl-gamma-D-glutamyl-meso-diaminopimelate ligase [Deltaproteobacteria bacterium]
MGPEVSGGSRFEGLMARHAHIVGVCGTAMAPLAGLLRETGWRVTGSDLNAYPPMSTQLDNLSIEVMKGYDAAHLDPRPDLVVIGNVCRKDNPEAVAAIERGIPYASMPSLLDEHFLRDRHAVVVTGTHGKTTTASLLAWLLDSAGRSPSFLVGGVPHGFGQPYGIGRGPHFVIEGDEYGTAFFDKGPKFLHYRPRTAIVTSIEFDHADIFRDFAHYRSAFERFVAIIPREGDLVAADDPAVAAVTAGAACRVHTYGEGIGPEYACRDVTFDAGGASFLLAEGGRDLGRLNTALPGMHNVKNAVAAAGACRVLGLSFDEIARGMASFAGVERRQTFRGVRGGVSVIDDFAHHPTAVRETLDAVRKKYVDGTNGRLVAVFEPRSNSSRRNVFQAEYAAAFGAADLAVIAAPYSAAAVDASQRLDPERLAGDITRLGTRAAAIPDVPKILVFLVGELRVGDVVLVMSNGAFDNLVPRLLEALSARSDGALA